MNGLPGKKRSFTGKTGITKYSKWTGESEDRPFFKNHQVHGICSQGINSTALPGT